MGELSFTSFGKTAFLLRLGAPQDDHASPVVSPVQTLARLAERLRASTVIVDAVPAYDELLVSWNPLSSRRKVEAFVREAHADLRNILGLQPPPRSHRITVCYDGPDLAAVAKTCGLSMREVIRLHGGATYTVEAVGFQPGFAYLGGLDPALALPRKSTPLTRVPSGSVAIAGSQTAIYPHASPGGWHLIGRTDEPMLDVDALELGRFRVGDTVTFVAFPTS